MNLSHGYQIKGWIDMEMNKEKRYIKFRAWDTVKREMVYNVGIFPFNSSDICKFEGNCFLIIGNAKNRFIPMQFTGARDKNEKYIYEHDIVKWKYPYSSTYHQSDEILGVVTWNKHNCGFEVRQLTEGFYGYGCGSKARLKFYDMKKNFDFDDLEVVGNIYENPESLNKEK